MSLRKGTSFLFEGVSEAFQGADVVIGNLEGLLTTRLNSRSVPRLPFCGLPEFAHELRSMGFSAVSVANNHVLDHGPEMFLETVDILEGADLRVLGLRGSSGFHSEPAIFSIGGFEIGILAYNWIGTGKRPEADDLIAQSKNGLVNYTWNRDERPNDSNPGAARTANKRVHRDIQALRSKVDFLVLYPHWGYEFCHLPPWGVVQEAHSFIDSGVDLIIGSHPHVLQGYEQYRDRWIFYSLGNFLFDLPLRDARDGVILEYALPGDDPKPFELHFTSLDRFHRPQPASLRSRARLATLMDVSSSEIADPSKRDRLSDDVLYAQYEKTYRSLKWGKIPLLGVSVLRHPPVLLVIFGKFRNFLKWLVLRLRGERVRW